MHLSRLFNLFEPRTVTNGYVSLRLRPYPWYQDGIEINTRIYNTILFRNVQRLLHIRLEKLVTMISMVVERRQQDASSIRFTRFPRKWRQRRTGEEDHLRNLIHLWWIWRGMEYAETVRQNKITMGRDRCLFNRISLSVQLVRILIVL